MLVISILLFLLSFSHSYSPSPLVTVKQLDLTASLWVETESSHIIATHQILPKEYLRESNFNGYWRCIGTFISIRKCRDLSNFVADISSLDGLSQIVVRLPIVLLVGCLGCTILVDYITVALYYDNDNDPLLHWQVVGRVSSLITLCVPRQFVSSTSFRFWPTRIRMRLNAIPAIEKFWRTTNYDHYQCR